MFCARLKSVTSDAEQQQPAHATFSGRARNATTPAA